MVETIINYKNKIVLYTGRICCYNNEFIELHCKIDSTNTLNIKFLFFNDKNNKKTYIKSNISNKTFNIELFNFNNPLGSGTLRPVRIATYKNKPIEITFSAYKLNNASPILDVTIYTEERK